MSLVPEKMYMLAEFRLDTGSIFPELAAVVAADMQVLMFIRSGLYMQSISAWFREPPEQ